MSKPLHVIGAIAVAFLSLARTSDAWAGCSPSDFADALVNTVGDGASFLKNHAKCAPHFSDPAFWTISGGVTLLATSSSDVKNTCHDIENLDASAGGTQQKIESIYHQLPSDAQNAIKKIAGVDDINSSSADLAAVLSFLSCACALANESGAPQITQVLGNIVRPMNVPPMKRLGERGEKRATMWLCCEAAANESLQPNSLIHGKIQGISLETSLPACTKPLRNGASLDEFPAIETGNFFREKYRAEQRIRKVCLVTRSGHRNGPSARLLMTHSGHRCR